MNAQRTKGAATGLNEAATVRERSLALLARAVLVRSLTLAALLLPSCVIEEQRPSRSQRSLPGAVGGAAPNRPGDSPTLPDGPIATPVPTTASTSAALRFTMLPLGVVSFDAQVLPLVSPDGRFMAVEDGDAPSWATLLGQADSSPAIGTRLVIYDLTVSPLKEVSPVERFPVGAILGRAADVRGFLIEWPRPDGSRWIGRCAWVGGRVEWLVRDDAVNAHATLSTTGALAYTARVIGAPRARLVVRDHDGLVRELDTPEVSYCLPVFSSDGRLLFTPAMTAEGLEFLALRAEHSDGTRLSNLGQVLARRLLAKDGDLALAYQVMAPCQNVPSVGSPRETGGDATPEEKPPLLYHPALGRMAAFDWQNAAFLPLASKSIAAVHSPIPASPGYFQTTPAGLVFTPPPTGAQTPAAEARVMDTPFVPRATTDPLRPLILLGPAQPKRLQVVVFGMPPASPAPVQ